MIRDAETVVDILRRRATEQPERIALVHLDDGETRESKLTYAELDRRARSLAVRLREMDAAGERALLLHPQGLDYVVAFFGCLYAGAVAVPLYPPANARMLPRLRAIANDAAPAIALTTSAVLDGLRESASRDLDLSTVRFVATDALDADRSEDWRPRSVGAGEVAFLQYTSGSTATPKGVIVSHGNLLHNQRALQACWEHTELSVLASWLPLFHDMGLVGNVLQAIFVGAPCVLMLPTHFLQRPVRWLQAITRHRATTSGGPNFAYDLCVEKITPAEISSLDLSSWTVAFNGAEPIRHATLERFEEAFAPCGFRRAAFFPGYGLAEATLVVSAGRKSDAPVTCALRATALDAHQVIDENPTNGNARILVGCGRAVLDGEIVIVHPERGTRALAGDVGEIWVSSPSVARGYWRRPEESERVFRATLPDASGKLFLRTGDLGFVRGEELYVTGRLKDLLIVRGRNHYPQDIEWTVEASHSALRSGGSAAFAIDGTDEERVVVAAEVVRSFDVAESPAVFDAVRRAVALHHELRLHAAVLLKPGALPKTTSGKVQRRACRAAYLARELDSLAATEFPREAGGTAPRTALEREVAAIWTGILELADVEVDEDFFRLGGDSLRAAQVIAGARIAFGVELPIGLLFEHPTVAGMAAEIAALRAAAPAETPLLARSGIRDRGLSFAQQRLWFLDQLEPGSSLYVIPVRVRLTGTLDARRLERCLNAIVRRHEALRTTFPTIDGKPVASLSEDRTFSIPVVEARDAADAERLAGAEARRPFDLATGPLVRAMLVRLENDVHDLLLTMHHIVSDGRSVRVFLRELAAFYEADAEDRPPALINLDIQYADFAAWQRERVSRHALDEQLAYWTERLAGAPLLALPTDRPRPAGQSHLGAGETVHLPASLVAGLAALGRREGVTLFMTLLAAFDVMLHRTTGQDDICVGTAIAARDRVEINGLIGLFANTLVLRVDLSGDPTFRELLARVRDVALGAYAHHDVPFEKLVDALGVERSLGRQPLFQAMLVLQDSSPLALAFAGIGATVRETDRGASLVDVSLSLVEHDGGLQASLEYATDLFDRTTARRMLDHFRTILDDVVDGPTRRLSQLSLSSEAERLALRKMGTGAPALRSFVCVHQLFEQQVDRTPDAVAVVHDGERLAYRELNRRASRLALRLRSLGVGPEVRVGVCVERSIDLLTSVLAVLKAGGAYVPLDPANPAERTAFMLADSDARIVLTTSRVRQRVPTGSATVVSVDDEDPADANANENRSHSDSGVSEANLAYVIFTSGSTGRPKGVAITHRSSVAFLEWATRVFDSESLAGVLASTSIAFDLSVFEMFAPLVRGGTVVLAENALALPSLAAASNVTLVNTVPSAMAELVRSRGIPSSVKTINLAGEALSPSLVERLFEIPTIDQIFNLYGPTETTTYSTLARLERSARGSSPIGRPIAGTRIVLLDPHGHLVPIGVAGEIFIGGSGVARGYLGRPDLTAEQFVPDAFSGELGARLYRTGDLARWRADGQLEYLGRIDHQVKIRGFRIELGEVEAALSRHASVRDAAVVSREESSNEKRLVGYVVLREHESASPPELRRFLATTLPDHMIPAAFVFLEALPLTSNGKLDRRALPAFDGAGRDIDRVFVPPRTPAEEIIAGIWRDALRMARIGVHDNFFELGGDSILAVQIAAAARKAGLAISTRQLFERQTIAELAEIAAAAEPRAPSRMKTVVSGTAPLTPIQRWFFLQELADSHHWNQALLLEVDRSLEPALLEHGLNRVVAHHDALRLRFTGDGASWLQSHTDDVVTVPFACIDLSTTAPREQLDAIESTTAHLQASLDLARGPLLRAAWFDLGSERPARLFLVAHHLVVDVVSWQILLDDLATACESIRRNIAIDLLPVKTSFQEWAERLDALDRSGELGSECDFWLDDARCGGARVPLDFAEGDDSQAMARTVMASLDREATRLLLRGAAPAAARVEGLLLAALAETLAEWTGSRRMVVDVEGHGREPSLAGADQSIDLTRTVGWFTTLFPQLLDLSETRGPEDVLAAVIRQLRSTPRRGFGYGILRHSAKRDGIASALAAIPRANVLFNYLGQIDSALPRSGLFRFAAESIGPTRAPSGRRSHLLEVNASVRDERLRVEWTFGKGRHRVATIETLAARHLASLRAHLAHPRAADGRPYDPADFPDVALDQNALDKIVEAVTRGRKESRR